MMRRAPGPGLLAVAGILAVVLSIPAAAQNPFGTLGSGERVYVSFRWDPAPLVALGFGTGFDFDALNRAAAIDLELRKPVFLGGWRDLQIRAGSRIELASGADIGVVNGIDLIIHIQDNVRMRGVGLAIRERVLAGFSGLRGFGAAEADFTWFARNRILFKPSEEAIWVRGGGGKITLGGAGGIRSSGGVELGVDAALVKTAGWRNFNPAGPPILAGLSVGLAGRE